MHLQAKTVFCLQTFAYNCCAYTPPHMKAVSVVPRTTGARYYCTFTELPKSPLLDFYSQGVVEMNTPDSLCKLSSGERNYNTTKFIICTEEMR